MGRFLNKRIVVTGRTSGIGLVGARRLAEEGTEVFVTGRKDPSNQLPVVSGSSAMMLLLAMRGAASGGASFRDRARWLMAERRPCASPEHR